MCGVTACGTISLEPEVAQSNSAGKQRINMVSQYCPSELRAHGGWSMDSFIMKHVLGLGFASKVYLAVHRPTLREMAVKMYQKSKLSPLCNGQVLREIEIHKDLNHKNIVQLYGAWEDHRAYYLVMEYAPNGDVFKHVQAAGGHYSESFLVQSIITPFLSALTYLHSKNIVHRDIKPENCVLTTDNVIKITDFGLSCDLSTSVATTRLGTLDYMAPEVVRNPDTQYAGQHHGRADLWYGFPVDAWAVGTLTYELLVGEAPFRCTDKKVQISKIQTSEVRYPGWMPPLCRSFISWALCKEPSKRPTVSQLANHSWLQGCAPLPAPRKRGLWTSPMLPLPSSPAPCHLNNTINPFTSTSANSTQNNLLYPDAPPHIFPTVPSTEFNCKPLPAKSNLSSSTLHKHNSMNNLSDSASSSHMKPSFQNHAAHTDPKTLSSTAHNSQPFIHSGVQCAPFFRGVEAARRKLPLLRKCATAEFTSVPAELNKLGDHPRDSDTDSSASSDQNHSAPHNRIAPATSTSNLGPQPTRTLQRPLSLLSQKSLAPPPSPVDLVPPPTSTILRTESPQSFSQLGFHVAPSTLLQYVLRTASYTELDNLDAIGEPPPVTGACHKPASPLKCSISAAQTPTRNESPISVLTMALSPACSPKTPMHMDWHNPSGTDQDYDTITPAYAGPEPGFDTNSSTVSDIPHKSPSQLFVTPPNRQDVEASGKPASRMAFLSKDVVGGSSLHASLMARTSSSKGLNRLLSTSPLPHPDWANANSMRNSSDDSTLESNSAGGSLYGRQYSSACSSDGQASNGGAGEK